MRYELTGYLSRSYHLCSIILLVKHAVDTSKFIDYKKGVFSFSFYLIY